MCGGLRMKWRQGDGVVSGGSWPSRQSGRWSLGLLLLLLAVVAVADPPLDVRFQPVVIETPHSVVKLAPYSLVFEDPSHSLTIDDIIQPEYQIQFQPHPGGLEFGYTDASVWIAFVIDNRQQSEDEFVLDIAYPLLDDITLYEPGYDTDGNRLRWVSRTLGDERPYGERSLKLRTFAFKLNLPPGQVRTYFVRVATTSSLSVPLTLYSEDAYYEFLHDHQTFIGIFYGICFGLLAYNLFLYLSLREKTYLLYLGVVISNVYTASCFDGFNYRLLPDYVYWQSVAIYADICLTMWFSHHFTRVYLETRSALPRFDRVLQVLAKIVMLELVLILLMPGKLMSILVLLTIAVSVISILTAATLRLRSGFLPARLFLLAWIVMLTPIFIGVLNALHVLSFHAITPYIHKLGVAGEMIILSLALGARINLLKQAEAEAKQQVQRVEMEAKAKSEFLAKMSHEIRTPMNGVLGMAELLKETPLRNDQSNYVRTIYNSGQALLAIINDILDFSKIESGHLVLESVEFDLAELVDDSVSVFSLRSREQNVPLQASIDSLVPVRVKGDPTRLRQVLINLLGNAFKFTERGEVRLQVTLEAQDDIWNRVRFAITDSGIGISPDQQARLFRSFSQADASTTRKYGGTGLGLAICKELVEHMGGEIGVDSRLGHGSTFWFTVVLESVVKQPVARRSDAAEMAHPDANLGQLRVLVVEDNNVNQLVILGMLKRLGIMPDIASNGLEGVEQVKAAAQPYDVILMDCEMPLMDGYTATERIREYEQGSGHRTSIIALTAHAMSEHLARSQAVGMDEHVAKPVSLEVLRDVLERAVPERPQTQRVSTGG